MNAKCERLGHVPDWDSHYHQHKEIPFMKPRSVTYATCKRCKLVITTGLANDGWHQMPGIEQDDHIAEIVEDQQTRQVNPLLVRREKYT